MSYFIEPEELEDLLSPEEYDKAHTFLEAASNILLEGNHEFENSTANIIINLQNDLNRVRRQQRSEVTS